MSATKISSYIPRNLVFTDIPPGDRDDVLRLAVDRLVDSEALSADSGQTVYRGILKRERIGSTGVGRGIAIPHCKTSAVEAPFVSFMKPLEPVDYGATDGSPVHSLFVVISPLKAADEHLAIMRWIAKIARNDYYAKLLSTTRDPDSLHELFQEIDDAG